MTVRALLLGSLSFAIFLVADLALLPGISLTSNEQLRAVGTGFHSFERGRGIPIVWTSGHAELTFADVDRRTDWRLKANVRTYRPRGVPQPALRIAVDGQPILEQNLRGGTTPLDVVVPRHPGGNGAHVTIDATPPFFPRGKDGRELGVALEAISLTPEGFIPPPLSAVAAGVLSVLFLGAAIAATGLRTWRLDAILVFAGWCVAWLMTRRLALYFGYPVVAALVGAAVAAGALLVTYAITSKRNVPLSNAASAVIAISITACYLKLLVLLHPFMPIGDGVFHAHRFEYVLGGRLFFTSIAPGNYAFPYPVLLYVVSAPFSFFASDTLDRMALLRIVTTASDAVAGALLYWMIVRTTGDRIVGAAAVIWYHAIPMTAWIMTWGNLTNAFGQSLFVAALALIVALPVEWKRRSTVMLVAAVSAAALLSHPSTFAISTGIFVAIAALYYWRGGEALQSNAAGLAAATAIALAAAVVLYYAWFPSVYVSELGRVASEAEARVSGPATTLGTRVALEPVLAGQYFGWVAMVTALGGLVVLWKRRGPAQLTLAMAAWTGVCLLFVILGVLSPMEFRYHFAFFPVLALAAAYACGWAWRERTAFRAAALVLMTLGVWVGMRQWVWVLSW